MSISTFSLHPLSLRHTQTHTGHSTKTCNFSPPPQQHEAGKRGHLIPGGPSEEEHPLHSAHQSVTGEELHEEMMNTQKICPLFISGRTAFVSIADSADSVRTVLGRGATPVISVLGFTRAQCVAPVPPMVILKCLKAISSFTCELNFVQYIVQQCIYCFGFRICTVFCQSVSELMYSRMILLNRLTLCKLGQTLYCGSLCSPEEGFVKKRSKIALVDWISPTKNKMCGIRNVSHLTCVSLNI